MTLGRVVELFAGVGGFRLGLERTGWTTVWSNQWEPSTRTQHASDCYVARFGPEGHLNEDVGEVLDRAEAGDIHLPDHELLVGGYPCQDYSVARTLNQAHGLVGRKGVLWWEIHRLLRLKRPPYLFLENVDRLLKSPADQRGRDFAVMLASLADLGYEVEWRVVNAADYGFPQRRRRVYVCGRLEHRTTDALAVIERTGVLARALPVQSTRGMIDGADLSDVVEDFTLDADLADLSTSFGSRTGRSPFRNAGLMRDRRVWTMDVTAAWNGPRTTLGDILEPAADVPAAYYVPEAQLASWRYLKGAKREPRTHRASGTPYEYVEGSIPFPDPLDRPSRTILTGEGGATPSRFKHLIQVPDGRFRRLTPVELERLDGFPDGWTDTGMPEGRRAFALGNALVVGIVERIGRELMVELESSDGGTGEAPKTAVAS